MLSLKIPIQNSVIFCKTRLNWCLFLSNNDMAYNVTKKYYDMDLKLMRIEKIF